MKYSTNTTWGHYRAPGSGPRLGVFLALFGQARKVTFQALSSSRYEQYLRVLGLPFRCSNSSKYLTEP